jgi:alpha-L-glutamate ligase-like protein
VFGFASPRRLAELGVVGMNRRNLHYIGRSNQRCLYPNADDKLKSKILCEAAGIAVPKLLGVARVQRHVKQLAEFLSGMEQFVIKPSKGSGGKGILVIEGRDGDRFLKPSGEALGIVELQRDVANILSGLYSLGGKNDVAMIEALVQFADCFEGFSYEGVPDVRVIVYRGYPVMAMMRLSTRVSDGKANLHQGAVGVGLELATGGAQRAVQYNRLVNLHPDTKKPLAELSVPGWDALLSLASQCYEVTGLGYLGVDIVIDQQLGPMVMELNARPGLAIQMANGSGLGKRLELIDKQSSCRSFEQRVDFVLSKFC